MQPRQREVRGLLREVEDRVLPRLRLGRGYTRGVHGHARRLSQMVQGCQDKGRPGLQEPHAVPQGLGSASSVGWIWSKIPTAVPCGQISPTLTVGRLGDRDLRRYTERQKRATAGYRLSWWEVQCPHQAKARRSQVHMCFLVRLSVNPHGPSHEPTFQTQSN